MLICFSVISYSIELIMGLLRVNSMKQCAYFSFVLYVVKYWIFGLSFYFFSIYIEGI